jgi:hypothetical protein
MSTKWRKGGRKGTIRNLKNLNSLIFFLLLKIMNRNGGSKIFPSIESPFIYETFLLPEKEECVAGSSSKEKASKGMKGFGV